MIHNKIMVPIILAGKDPPDLSS